MNSENQSTRNKEPAANKTSENLDSAASETTPDNGNAQELTSSKDRRLHYFRNGIDADCEVHVLNHCSSEDERNKVCYKKFRCHRLFLATASDKLEQDIYQNNQWNGVLQINGVAPEAVEIFLEYIYTFEVTSPLVELKHIGDIFILACAYNMPELLMKYAEQLKHKDWPIDRIFPVLDLAFRHNINELENACISKVIESAQALMAEPSFMKLQIYPLNFVVQHWIATKAIAQTELLQLLRRYQEENEIKFTNTQKFPHFTKIIRYFPDVLLDAEGFIHAE